MSQKRSLEIEDNEIHCKKIKLDSGKIKKKTFLKHNTGLDLKQHEVQKFISIFQELISKIIKTETKIYYFQLEKNFLNSFKEIFTY